MLCLHMETYPRFEISLPCKKNVPLLIPNPCAQTQGWLGYLLQQSLNNRLKERGIRKKVVTVLTQIIVDDTCTSFKNPTKPVGIYYSKYKAERMMTKGIKMIKDAKGYRKVVASPMPQAIVEEEVIKELVSKGYIVIAAGGGGIPVKEQHACWG